MLEFCKTQSDLSASCSIQSDHVLPYPVFQILRKKACNHVTGRDIVTEKSTVIFDRFREMLTKGNKHSITGIIGNKKHTALEFVLFKQT